MSMEESALALLVVGVTAIVWRDALRARERAAAVCQRLCQSYDLQFLDHTVSLSTLRPVRTPRGSLGLRRVYTFDFSRDGAGRESGSVTLLGESVLAFYVPPDERPT